MGLRLPKTKGMLRREAAKWLARLQGGRDPNVERNFRYWHDGDSKHAAAFDRVRRSYEQAGLLRSSPIAVTNQPQPSVSNPQWKPRPALAAAAAALAVMIPVGVLVVRGGVLPLGGTDTMMLMTAVGEIREVDLADGSRVTLDTATKVEVQIGRSRRSVHLRYGRARFQVAPASMPFVVETASGTITTRQGVIDVEQVGEPGRVRVLAGSADVRGSGQGKASSLTLGAGEAVMVNAGGAEQKWVSAPDPDWTRGMLQFDGTPLPDAVALTNRYSERHVILAGDLGALKVTGAFRAGDTAGFARALAVAFSLSLQQSADDDLVLARDVPPGLQKKKGG